MLPVTSLYAGSNSNKCFGPEAGKYFVPDISDIRVGYECQIRNTFFIYPQGWPEKTSLMIREDLDFFCKMCAVGRNRNTATLECIARVPYLTKEQIEAEGWTIETQDDQLDYGTKGRHTLKFFHQYKQNPSVWLYFFGELVYKGECKDINTFRMLCKLVAIE